jgi:hypothetical protein
VWISCTQAHNGVVIEIEDAGVGMTPEAMERANTLLSTAPTPDLSGLKGGAQIGLWVVAELAKRGGMQVTLRTSAYGGVLAVVLLPVHALASADDLHRVAPDPEDTQEKPVPIAVPDPQPVSVSPPAPSYAPERARPVPAAQAATNAATAPPARPAGAVASARPPLPQRRPQEHLAPQLKDDSTVDQAAGPAHSPETARDRFARYQKGWRAGRTGDITPPARTTE